MLLALAASLVNHQGACRASAVATEYAKAFDPARGYGGSAQQVNAKRLDHNMCAGVAASHQQQTKHKGGGGCEGST